MNRLTVTLAALCLAWMAVLAVEAWSEPWTMDRSSRIGGSARYHCCCPNCPGRRGLRGCFPCRNQQYYCNCESCSCFPEKPVDTRSFLQMLMRSGFGGSKLRRSSIWDRK